MTKKRPTDAELKAILNREFELSQAHAKFEKEFDELMDKLLSEDPDFWKKVHDEVDTTDKMQDNAE